MDTVTEKYPKFEHPASSLSAFSFCIDVFIISLKNGEIVHFKPVDIIHFGQWLNIHSVRNIKVDDGSVYERKSTNG